MYYISAGIKPLMGRDSSVKLPPWGETVFLQHILGMLAVGAALGREEHAHGDHDQTGVDLDLRLVFAQPTTCANLRTTTQDDAFLA